MKKYYLFLVGIIMIAFSTLLLDGCKKDAITPAGNLTLKIDTSLDAGGDIKATSFTKGVMKNYTGTIVSTGTVTSGNLVFNLSGISAGDYFIVVNDLLNDQVPTRIADASKTYIQTVGQKFRDARIILGSETLYRIKTYSQGQGEHPVRKYSDGSNLPNNAWVILSYKATPTVLEIRTMEDNRLLFAPTATNQGPHKFVDWIMGGANHGKGPAGNLAATTAQCGTCHTNFNTKPASWSQITATNGNCYKCHYSIAGDPEGFLDPTK
ncbi:MAG: hypothetical protein M1292_15425 [Bacteroidetes bacterium]|nr:hypothetical protein [Bacteroidota bacterium]